MERVGGEEEGEGGAEERKADAEEPCSHCSGSNDGGSEHTDSSALLPPKGRSWAFLTAIGTSVTRAVSKYLLLWALPAKKVQGGARLSLADGRLGQSSSASWQGRGSKGRRGGGECEGLLLLVSCEDTGCGIANEDKELVFHAFTRVRNVGWE